MINYNKNQKWRKDQCVIFSKTKDPFGEFQNMCGGMVLDFDKRTFRTSEHLYQCAKSPNKKLQEKIIAQASPMSAAMIARAVEELYYPDWMNIRVPVMSEAIRVKYSQHATRMKGVFDRTEGRPIVEFSRKDDFWGAKQVDPDDDFLVGANVLGQLWFGVGEDINKRHFRWEYSLLLSCTRGEH